METAELREGNFVYEESLGLCRVVGIHKERDMVWLNNEYGIKGKVKKEFVKPIPISQDWIDRFTISLEAYGFKMGVKKGSLYIRLKNTDLVTLIYVHQYQTLFHCLTGDELLDKNGD